MGDGSPWPVALPSARRPGPRRCSPAPPQARQDRPEHRAAGLHPGRPGPEAGTDLRESAPDFPRPAGDARRARDDLPGPLRPGSRRTAPRAGPGPSLATRPPPPPPPGGLPPAAFHAPDGRDQRTSRRGGGPGGARPLGRGLDHRGNGDRTRTPTACCDSTSPRAPTCPSTPANTWPPSPPNSTAAHAKRSTGKPQPSACINYSPPNTNDHVLRRSLETAMHLTGLLNSLNKIPGCRHEPSGRNISLILESGHSPRLTFDQPFIEEWIIRPLLEGDQ
ncbi:hypothetical protein QFZ74_003784 [Streptomyces sp. V3I7]|nr:hypothetical protein [Streptomyces sp. V3I7]